MERDNVPYRHLFSYFQPWYENIYFDHYPFVWISKENLKAVLQELDGTILLSARPVGLWARPGPFRLSDFSAPPSPACRLLRPCRPLKGTLFLTGTFPTSSSGMRTLNLIITCLCELQKVNSEAPLPETKSTTTALPLSSTATSPDLTDDKLLSLKVRELNNLLRSLPPKDRRRLKERRHRLKVRDRQQNCRSRRENNSVAEVSILSAEWDYYQQQVECLQARGVREWLSCSHSLSTPIASFSFPPIPILSHHLHSRSHYSHSHSRQRHTATFYVSCGSATMLWRNGDKYYIFVIDNSLLFPAVKMVNNSRSYCKSLA